MLSPKEWSSSERRSNTERKSQRSTVCLPYLKENEASKHERISEKSPKMKIMKGYMAPSFF